MAKKKTPEIRLSLRIVIYRQGKYWFAHCLEMDIVAESTSPKQAFVDLLELMAFQVSATSDSGDDFASVFRPAPPEMWKAFWKGRDFDELQPATPGCIHRIEARQLALC